MKITLTTITACLLLFACNSVEQKDGSSETSKSKSSPKSEIEKKVTARDYSITPEQAFNDIFLDSSSMEKFISSANLGDSVMRRMRSFYNARNYQYAWFSSKGLTEQTRGFWNLQSYYSDLHKNSSANFKKLSGYMDGLETADDLKVTKGDQKILETEFLLTEHFIKYILENYEDGIVKRKELERFIPLKKRNALEFADSLLTKKHNDDKYYEDGNTAYKLLKEKLQQYYTVATSGGWPGIPASKGSLKVGATSPAVLLLKKRLMATGELAIDTTNVFDAQTEAAVKLYQQSRGLTPDGVITAALIKDMNVPVGERIKQLLVNMDRMRWMPEPEGNLFLVNIPEFELKAYEGSKKAFSMDVVVGKEGHNTNMFKGDMNQVVFSPYWNLTPDIIRDEIVPAMQRNPNYLARHNMEIVSGAGTSTPVIRQLPGEDNSLGKVKFLFPNSFNIYFHDTPAKALFSKDKRAYSHGCIRLSEPEKLAEYVLRNDPQWTPERINEAMNSGKEQYVKLSKSVPVIITYYTAWVDDNGMLNFRDDIYGYDKAFENKLFAPSASNVAVNSLVKNTNQKKG